MDEREDNNNINYVEEEDKKEFQIKCLHEEVDLKKLPYISCFEVSAMLSGKWVAKMFDNPDKYQESLTISAKNKFTFLAYDSPTEFLKKFHNSLLKQSTKLRYSQNSEGEVSKEYLYAYFL